MLLVERGGRGSSLDLLAKVPWENRVVPEKSSGGHGGVQLVYQDKNGRRHAKKATRKEEKSLD